MTNPKLLTGLVFAAASFAVVSSASLANTGTFSDETITRSCPSGQSYDSVAGVCKSFFDIRGSFAVPTTDDKF